MSEFIAKALFVGFGLLLVFSICFAVFIGEEMYADNRAQERLACWQREEAAYEEVKRLAEESTDGVAAIALAPCTKANWIERAVNKIYRLLRESA